MSLNWASLETALKAWVAAASGLDASRVLMSYERYQGGARPVSGPHITIQFGPMVTRGIDGSYSTTNLGRAAGEEMVITSIATREMTVTLQCFGGATAGAGTALATLSRVRERLALPSVRDALSAVGLSPFGPGPVTYVPSIEGTKFEGRAVFEVRCLIDASEQEFCGYIASVDIEARYYGAVGTFFVGTFYVETGA